MTKVAIHVVVCDKTKSPIDIKSIPIYNTSRIITKRTKKIPISFSTSLLLAICLLCKVQNQMIKTMFPIKLVSTIVDLGGIIRVAKNRVNLKFNTC